MSKTPVSIGYDDRKKKYSNLDLMVVAFGVSLGCAAMAIFFIALAIIL